jgi:hypothetical protein
MSKRSTRAGSLTDAEVGIIRNLLNRGGYKNQDILGLLNTVRRLDGREEINGGRVSEVKTEKPQYAGISAASDKDTDDFIQNAENPAAYGAITSNPLSKKRLSALFPLDKGKTGKLAIAETDLIECKESFGTQHLISNCIRAIAAFANNNGGYIAFGVKDATWELKGIDGDKFRGLDRKKFNRSLLSVLSCAIDFEMETLDVGGKTIGVMYIAPATIKPVIAISNGKDGVSVGHIYYRYQAENRMIGPSELQQIIEGRIRDLSETILTKHLSTILANGIENSAILNINTGQVDGKAGSFLIDEEILPEISFIKEGEFEEKSGAPTLKLVGEVKKAASVIKTQKEELIKLYPYSWKELAAAVKEKVPGATVNTVNRVIREHDVKSNAEYAAYNFRNNQQAESYDATGKIPGGTPTIYNQAAVEFVAEKAEKIIGD